MKELFKTMSTLVGRYGLVKYIILALGSGLCSFLFIKLVTNLVAIILSNSYTEISEEYIIIFILVILLFIWIRKELSLGLIGLSQDLLWKLRRQVLVLVLGADYRQVATRKTNVQTALMNDVDVILNAFLIFIDFLTAVILAFCCLAYLLWISWILFLITMVVSLAGVTVYHLNSKKNMKDIRDARQLENDFQDNISSILNGFKEIFMDPRKGKVINEGKIDVIAAKSRTMTVDAFSGFLNNQIIGQVLFYLLISAVLVIFSVKLNINAGDIVSFVFTLLYLLGAITTIMSLLPGIVRARVSSDNLVALKKDLESVRSLDGDQGGYIEKDKFVDIKIKDLVFQYGEVEKSFGIGPIDFEIQKGEAIFIYGGNGSGKTTFIYAILGLCKPGDGEIRLNDVRIDHENYSGYRRIFSVVFSDFFLFKELLLIDELRMDKWDYYIHLFELDGKVWLEGSKLSTTELSMGEKKRLTLIMTLLEEKPVLVIDEWAADQDPYFRKKFYTEIIPLLKSEGVTIIAITHDDKYYHCADRLYKMDYGRLKQVKLNFLESEGHNL